MKYIIAISLLIGGYSSFGITKDLVNPFTLVKPVNIAQGKHVNFIDQSKQTILSQLSQDERKTFHIWKKEYFHNPKSFQAKFETIGFLIYMVSNSEVEIINKTLHVIKQELARSAATDTNDSHSTHDLKQMKTVLNFFSQLTDTEIATMNQWVREYREQGQENFYRKVYLIMEEVMYGSRNLL